LCNAVYVDDVVNSLVLASESSGAVGQRFLISGADRVSWRQFFEAYEHMIGTSSLTYLPAAELEDSIRRNPSSVRRAGSLTRDPRALLRGKLAKKAIATARPLVGQRLMAAAKERVPRPLSWPTQQELALYRARTSVSIAHARQVLGYDPAVPFDEGMARTHDFVVWAGL
jgi:nucleoside-diphosphate-sugar epimerase